MRRKILFAIGLAKSLALGVLAMSSSLAADPRKDAAELLQLLIEARPLSRYFHFATHPQRAPLRIVNRSGVEIGTPALSTGGHAAIVTAEGGERPLELRRVEIGSETAEIRFAFPAEGVTGEGKFRRVGGVWKAESVRAREH